MSAGGGDGFRGREIRGPERYGCGPEHGGAAGGADAPHANDRARFGQRHACDTRDPRGGGGGGSWQSERYEESGRGARRGSNSYRDPRSNGGRDSSRDSSRDGSRTSGRGLVSSIKEGFGFITPRELKGESVGFDQEQIFFHGSAVIDRTLLQPGDEVRFVIEKDRSGRDAAARVELLPKGTLLPPPPHLETFAQAIVERVAAGGGGFRSRDGAAGGRVRVVSMIAEAGATVAAEGETREGEGEVLPFEGREVARGVNLVVGDLVECLILGAPGQVSREEEERSFALPPATHRYP